MRDHAAVRCAPLPPRRTGAPRHRPAHIHDASPDTSTQSQSRESVAARRRLLPPASRSSIPVLFLALQASGPVPRSSGNTGLEPAHESASRSASPWSPRKSVECRRFDSVAEHVRVIPKTSHMPPANNTQSTRVTDPSVPAARHMHAQRFPPTQRNRTHVSRFASYITPRSHISRVPSPRPLARSFRSRANQ